MSWPSPIQWLLGGASTPATETSATETSVIKTEMEKNKTRLTELEAGKIKVMEKYIQLMLFLANGGITFFSVSAFGLLVAYNTSVLKDKEQTRILLVIGNSIGFFFLLWARAVEAVHLTQNNRSLWILSILVGVGVWMLSTFIMVAITGEWPFFQLIVCSLTFVGVGVPYGVIWRFRWLLRTEIEDLKTTIGIQEKQIEIQEKQIADQEAAERARLEQERKRLEESGGGGGNRPPV